MFELDIPILLVDDMKSMRTMIKGQLRTLGYSNFVEAEDGEKAFEALETRHLEGHPIRLVLSDWNMPKITGIDFLRMVREDPRFKSLPFVMITAEGEGTQVKEAIKAGITTYIMKPFTAEIFRQKISSLGETPSA